jgi:NAD(P)-dependent dehydrogenase (short-subunit alcohol dehydrogenase family)
LKLLPEKRHEEKNMTKKFNASSTADEVLSEVNLKGKRFLVTGVSSGIGLETARSLVAHGANVIGVVRNLAKAEPATATIRDAALQSGGSIELIELDLASLQSVRSGAAKVLADGRPFNGVIANAGVMATPFGRTIDGFETQFGTNHLGHFALINRIAPLLGREGRLVVLSSQAHRIADVDLDDPNFERQPYDPFLAYGRSKTANALFAVEFDRRHRDGGVRAASVMPGNSLTELPRHFSKEDLQSMFEAFGKGRAEAGQYDLAPGKRPPYRAVLLRRGSEDDEGIAKEVHARVQAGSGTACGVGSEFCGSSPEPRCC